MLRRLTVALTVMASMVGVGAAAAAPGLTVSDIGQPAVPVLSPDVSVAVPAGSCDEPFTLESRCPAGSWPALGSQWGSVLAIAGGDTLVLHLDAAASSVTVASTSDYVPGLTNPSGAPVPNYDVLPATAASATGDPTVWQIALGQLDVRAMTGYTFSVVAVQEGVPHGFALTIRAPRYEDRAHPCGIAYFSTSLSQYLCAEQGVPPGAGGAINSQPPPQFSLSPRAVFSKGRLQLRFVVGAPGSLRVNLAGPGLGRRVISKRVMAAGQVTLNVPLRAFHAQGRRIKVLATLKTAGGSISLARTLRVI